MMMKRKETTDSSEELREGFSSSTSSLNPLQVEVWRKTSISFAIARLLVLACVGLCWFTQ